VWPETDSAAQRKADGSAPHSLVAGWSSPSSPWIQVTSLRLTPLHERGRLQHSHSCSRAEELLHPPLALAAAERMRQRIVRQAAESPLTRRLMAVPGVGPLTATAYVATLDEPGRFCSSDQVAAYVGLVPSVAQSGELDLHGHITREGDGLLRGYLVEAAHVLLTRRRGSCALKRWGLKLARKKGTARHASPSPASRRFFSIGSG